MVTVNLIKSDLAKVVTDKAKPKGINFKKKIPVLISLEMDKAGEAAVAKDPLLQTKAQEAASKAYKTLVISISSDLKDADKRFMKSTDEKEREKIASDFMATTKAKTQRLEKQGAHFAQAAIKKVQKDIDDDHKYRLSVGIELASDAVELALSAASMAGSGGLSAIFVGYKTLRIIMKAALKIYQEALSAQKMQKKVAKHLKTIQKDYDKNRKELTGAKDTGKVLLNKIFGAKFVTTIDSVKSENVICHAKMRHITVKTHELSKQLNKLLEFNEKASKQIDAKTAKKAADAVIAMNKSIRKMIERIITMGAQANKGLEFCENTTKAINEIETQQPMKWKWMKRGLDVFEIVIAPDEYKDFGKVVTDMAQAAVGEVTKELAAQKR
ncbi:hypothetical protein DS901_18310 [Loktanella sp. D2R18]|uniref:hypothetical protein n=1 Tax=Rhodobacterales TaxID=204455 RepID=UPI000DE88FF4|nr:MULTISPECIES: hypothetical protein [Rhodobacterales]MDO6590547.1 hypothetical protein [Yoonia sp. 1_MG-2023]RBW41263.1 hypothetical protein DS901_18310 [Loktanella sp. D2R18]